MNKDQLRIRWVEKYKANIEFQPVLPDGKFTGYPWRLWIPGNNPLRGKSVRHVIDKAMKKKRKIICH